MIYIRMWCFCLVFVTCIYHQKKKLKRKADIIFLQETHSTVKTETQWNNEWGAEIITSHGSSNARGVAILIKAGFDCSIHQDRKSTRLNSSHRPLSRMPSSA